MKIIRINNTSGRFALMADSAMRPDRRPLFLPQGQWRCHIRPAVRICRLGKNIAPQFACRYYDAFALTNYLAPAQTPNVDPIFDMLDDTVVLGQWIPLSEVPAQVNINGQTARVGFDSEFIESFIAKLTVSATIKTGDIIILPNDIFSYTPSIGQHIDVSHDSTNLLQFNIK